MEASKLQKYDCIVVGAGIAGLTAAYTLQKHQLNVLVLERNEYVGGRTLTKFIDDIPVDFGAQFLSPFYKNTWNLLKELGLSPSPIKYKKLAIKRNGLLHSFEPDNLTSLLTYKGLSSNSKLRLACSLIKGLIKSRSLNLYDLKSLLPVDNKSVYDDMINDCGKENFTYFLDPMSTSLFCYDSRKFSKALFLATLPKLLRFKMYTLDSGINKLSLLIARKLTIQKELRVLNISKRDKSVIVKAVKTKSKIPVNFKADSVIVATPGNQALILFDNPPFYVKSFFSKVKYSKTLFIYCKGKTRMFEDVSTIWLPTPEDHYFSVINCNWYQRNKNNCVYFGLNLRENKLNKYKPENGDNISIAKIIQRQFREISDLEIFKIHYWQSALPIFYPGYMKLINSFLNQCKQEKGIYYAGDYLENPSIEGAVTSGQKAACQVLNKID